MTATEKKLGLWLILKEGGGVQSFIGGGKVLFFPH